MATAVWNGIVLAQSDETIIVEGNHYFPENSVNFEYLKPTQYHTTCHWKGLASYYSVEVDGNRNENAAWYYPNPKEAANQIKGYIAFWRGVTVTS